MPVKTLVSPVCTNDHQPILKVGDESQEVASVRWLLAKSRNRGFSVDELTVSESTDDENQFSLALEWMIKVFQHQVFLEPDGIVGAKTWKALCTDGPVDMPELRQGDRTDLTEEVKLLQARLAHGGYYQSTAIGKRTTSPNPDLIDGQFGPATQAALIRYQQQNGLVADGVVGAKTWEALSLSPGLFED